MLKTLEGAEKNDRVFFKQDTLFNEPHTFASLRLSSVFASAGAQQRATSMLFYNTIKVLMEQVSLPRVFSYDLLRLHTSVFYNFLVFKAHSL